VRAAPASCMDTLRWRLLAVLHFVIGAAALLGGGALVVWSNGKMLRLPVTLLAQSPFTDFLLPGVILFGTVGVFNLIACYLALRRESGAELISFLAGGVLLIWVGIEAVIIDASSWLQLVSAALAVLVVLDAIWIRRSRDAGSPARAMPRGDAAALRQ